MPDHLERKCPRCGTISDELYTVPIYLPAIEPNWLSLCRACFLAVLQVEPGDILKQAQSPRRPRQRR
jgi:hypothetical protein